MRLITNFYKDELDLYYSAIKEYEKAKGNKSILVIKPTAFDVCNRLIKDHYSLHCSIDKPNLNLSSFWKIFDQYKKKYTLHQIRDAFLKEDIDYSIQFLDKMLNQ